MTNPQLAKERNGVKASGFTDAHTAFIRQDEMGTPVSKICRKAGINPLTYFNWKTKYPGMLSNDVMRGAGQAPRPSAQPTR